VAETFGMEATIRQLRQEKPILLMTHIVLGYPSFDAGLRLVENMVSSGVDLMELQIPFSEPIADGPVILHANQRALEAGATVDKCLRFAEAVTARFPIPFLFMTYYNILFRFGVSAFVSEMKRLGVRGAIVPDLPPEEGVAFLTAMKQSELEPIFIYSPNTTDARLRLIAEHASGFLYCVARRGVTGSETDFGTELRGYLARCRAATALPLAVGFGVKTASDVASLQGHADIAVVGSETIRIVEREGVDAVSPFLRSLIAHEVGRSRA
jgi:tryptophan synthase alpha chain